MIFATSYDSVIILKGKVFKNQGIRKNSRYSSNIVFALVAQRVSEHQCSPKYMHFCFPT